VHRNIYTTDGRCEKELEEFGFGSAGLKAGDFIHQEKTVQFGVPPVRIEIITSIPVASRHEACSGKVKGEYSEIGVYYSGRDRFAVSKEAAGREGDIADLELLVMD
jgi:hypothetical protein